MFFVLFYVDIRYIGIPEPVHSASISVQKLGKAGNAGRFTEHTDFSVRVQDDKHRKRLSCI